MFYPQFNPKNMITIIADDTTKFSKSVSYINTDKLSVFDLIKAWSTEVKVLRPNFSRTITPLVFVKHIFRGLFADINRNSLTFTCFLLTSTRNFSVY